MKDSRVEERLLSTVVAEMDAIMNNVNILAVRLCAS